MSITSDIYTIQVSYHTVLPYILQVLAYEGYILLNCNVRQRKDTNSDKIKWNHTQKVMVSSHIKMNKNVTPNLQHSLSWHQHIYSSVTNGCRHENMLLKTQCSSCSLRLVYCQVVSGVVLAGTEIPGGGKGRTTPDATLSSPEWFCIEMGSDESNFNVSFIVRGKVTTQCLRSTTSKRERQSGDSNQHCPLTSLTPHR